MIVHFGTDLLKPEWVSATVCIGVFDGVHLGHQELIRSAVEQAQSREEPCVLVTFDRHPAWVLAPDRIPPAVATLSQNLDGFASLGVAVAVVIPFDQRTASTSASEFLDYTLKGQLRASNLVVGHDFALGKGREGTAEWLAARIRTSVVPPFEIEEHRVSSSTVRKLVADGEVARASRFLGRAFELRGIVTPGAKVGRQLGFPTVNLSLSAHQLVPSDGVYAGHCRTRLGTYAAAASIGNRPTVGGSSRTIEAYLIDYPGTEIYGTVVDLSFYERLRGQVKFPDRNALIEQMRIDVQQAVEILV